MKFVRIHQNYGLTHPKCSESIFQRFPITLTYKCEGYGTSWPAYSASPKKNGAAVHRPVGVFDKVYMCLNTMAHKKNVDLTM